MGIWYKHWFSVKTKTVQHWLMNTKEITARDYEINYVMVSLIFLWGIKSRKYYVYYDLVCEF